MRNMKKILFYIKISFRSRDFQIFVIFAFPHFPVSKGQLKVEEFMMSWIGSSKLADVIFGITQNPLYVTSSNLVK